MTNILIWLRTTHPTIFCGADIANTRVSNETAWRIRNEFILYLDRQTTLRKWFTLKFVPQKSYLGKQKCNVFVILIKFIY